GESGMSVVIEDRNLLDLRQQPLISLLNIRTGERSGLRQSCGADENHCTGREHYAKAICIHQSFSNVPADCSQKTKEELQTLRTARVKALIDWLQRLAKWLRLFEYVPPPPSKLR